MKNRDRLLNLLDFSHCKMKTDVWPQAKIITNELIQNWKIVTPAGEHRFLGLEFYLYIPGFFEDDATHRRCEQLKKGTFYFHTKTKNNKLPPAPPIFNRHGVDITCGDEKQEIYGGILLRHLSGEGSKDGSGRALRSLVRGDRGFRPIKRGSAENKWTNGEIRFFKCLNGQSIFSHEMYLTYAPLSEKVRITAMPRIGINHTRYADEKLRFIVQRE